MRRACLRTALAATIMAALCFLGGALWLRHELYATAYDASVRQAALQVRVFAAKQDQPGTGDRWLAIESYDKAQALRQIDALLGPVDLPAHTYQTEDGITKAKVRLFGDDLTLVAADAWTDKDGRTVLNEPSEIGPDGGFFTPDALARTKVTWYLTVPTTAADQAASAADRVIGFGLPITMLLVFLTAWYAAGRALRPVEATIEGLSDELAVITLDRRIPVPDSGDEIEGLAVTANATLGRLEQAAARQRRFIADAAHELRSPLAALRNTAEVARAAELPAALDVVLSSASRLQGLTDDLLLLARLDAPASTPAHPVDLAAIAEEQIEERRYDGDGALVFSVIVSGPAVVAGDQLQLERLLRNLLDNAVRHAAGTVTVTVTSSDGTVVVEVADDGSGIAPADRERVFEPFTRLDEARARDGGGTGLGLAIAHDIAARHGGHITVEDADGARFVLRLKALSLAAG